MGKELCFRHAERDGENRFALVAVRSAARKGTRGEVPCQEYEGGPLREIKQPVDMSGRNGKTLEALPPNLHNPFEKVMTPNFDAAAYYAAEKRVKG